MKIHNKPVLEFLKEHSILVLLIVLATFLRTYQLNTHGIFFFDAGHDLLAAHQAFTDGNLPLVGITSSRPWLHQGPLSIWLEMLVMLFFGTSTLAQHVFFALLGVGAIIGLYELITVHFSRRAAYYAVALLAVFPLAVANSRMPYHTTPIPLVTVFYLWALLAFWKKFSISRLIWVLLTGIILFQFELCNAPLLAIVPYVFWRRRYSISKKVLAIGVVTGLVGMLPQVFFYIFGGSNQLLEFSKWFFAQVLERLQGGGSFGQNFIPTLQAFWHFGGRIFGVDSFLLSAIGISATIFSLGFAAYQLRKHTLPPLIELSGLGTILLIIGYFLAGPPSEAYFPPFFILIPILLSYVFVSQKPKVQLGITIAVLIFMVINVLSIFRANFFVMNNQAFSYDSVGELRAVTKTLTLRSNGSPYQLATSDQAHITFHAYFDHIKWLAVAENLQAPSDAGKTYYLESNTNLQPPGTVQIKAFPTKTLYWDPSVVEYR